MIEPGRTLLHYRLAEKIGEGGMGVVWQALDTTLQRDVAIKILPDAFLQDPERVARFEREARLLAALNHPNIAGIYGTHEAEGCRFLAMELVAGEDLAARLSRGPLPREEALRIALEVAQGLEAAHDKGVIHRDLKPANVKLTADGAVKILDFGLAKAFAPESADSNPSMSPTLTSAGTIAGLILGTASYMSPEQAKGKEVDRRADIWSFGVLLFEMLAGRRMFQGETVSETLAAVMMQEIHWGALPGDTPPALRRLLQRCLQRDPRSRLRDVGDARIALEEVIRAPAGAVAEQATTQATRPAWRAAAPWVIAAVALALAAVGWLGRGSPSSPPRVMRLMLSMDQGQEVAEKSLPVEAVSPDGSLVVFVNAEDDLLYVRHLDRTHAVPLDGTEDSNTPVFSPDGRWIAFAQEGKLKKMPVLGGATMTLCEAPALRGAAWGRGGVIVFAPDRNGGLMRVAESGGPVEPLTTVDREAAGAVSPSHRWPAFLPDGKTVLFTSTLNDSDYSEAEIVAVSLDGGPPKTLVKGATFGRYVPGGFLVFTRRETLFGARFDPRKLELGGPAVPVLEGLDHRPSYGMARFTSSLSGLLIYGSRTGVSDLRSLVLLDRQGHETRLSEQTKEYVDAALSPDGSKVAVAIAEDEKVNIWLLDVERDNLARLTYDEQLDNSPLWSPDGEWIVFSSFRGGASLNLFRVRADGTGEAQRLTTSLLHHYANSWSPDGSVLAFTEVGGEMKADIMLLRMEPEPTVETYLRTPFNEGSAAISPDGKWLAYTSGESGEQEVYVRPFGRSGARVKISTGGGRLARWLRDAQEIVYRSADDKLMSVRYAADDAGLRPQSPVELFDYPEDYDEFQVAGDGFRLLTIKGNDAGRRPPRWPMMVVNWFDELEAKVPAR